jgi:hypothetical protein
MKEKVKNGLELKLELPPQVIFGHIPRPKWTQFWLALTAVKHVSDLVFYDLLKE